MYDSPPPIPRSVNLWAEFARRYTKPALTMSAGMLLLAFLVGNWQAQRDTQEKLDAIVASLALKSTEPLPQVAAASTTLPPVSSQTALSEPRLLPPIETAQPPLATPLTTPLATVQPAVVPAGGIAAREPEKLLPPARLIAASDVLIIEAALRDARTNQTDRIPLQLGGNEFAVGQDGSVALGGWGSVAVVGLTPEKAADMVRQKLSAFTQSKGTDAAGNFLVSVEVKGSTPPPAPLAAPPVPAAMTVPVATEVKPSAPVVGRACYVILDNGANGEQVMKVPYNGTETVIDAIAYIPGLTNDAGRRTIYLLRKGPAGTAQQALPVDWSAITQRGDTKTNYSLQAEDRLYVGSAR